MHRSSLGPLVLGLAVLFAACDGDGMLDPADPLVSDFSIVDTNPTSPRVGAAVSPRDYLGRISAWYFGHST